MTYIAKERLHLARDGKTVVKPGDPRSSSLLINEGGQMTDEEARKYGLLPPIGTPTEDALPLMSRLGVEKEPQTGVSSPIGTAIANTVNEGFPKSIKFGGQSTSPPPAEQKPETQFSIVQPLSSALSGNAPSPEGTSESQQTNIQSDNELLPDDFPYKSILADQGFTTREKVKAATKETLLTLKQIGSERADVIMASAEKL